jgi:Tfp pilus assembly protein PilF
MTMRKLLPVLASAALLGACAVAPPPAPVGVSELMDRPAEAALLAGLRAYDDGRYVEAEQAFDQALAAGLRSPRDLAAAYKHLAFIYCTSQRRQACAAAFRQALAADPQFTLARAETGHPLWGPVYREAAGR